MSLRPGRVPPPVAHYTPMLPLQVLSAELMRELLPALRAQTLRSLRSTGRARARACTEVRSGRGEGGKGGEKGGKGGFESHVLAHTALDAAVPRRCARGRPGQGICRAACLPAGKGCATSEAGEDGASRTRADPAAASAKGSETRRWGAGWVMGRVRGGGGRMVGGVGREARSESGSRRARAGPRSEGRGLEGWSRRMKGGVRKCRGGSCGNGCGASGVGPASNSGGRSYGAKSVELAGWMAIC